MEKEKEKTQNNGEEKKISDEELSEAVLRAERDPVFFSEALLDLHPFAYQEDFLSDKSKRIVICAGRRIGKSTMTAARGLWFALMHKKTTTLIISATLRQSILMFDTVLDYISRSAWIDASVQRRTRTLVRFKNGSKIKAYPCGKGKGIRGDTADLIILDEAAFMPDDVIAEAILPMLATTDGTVIMLSTPYDKCYTRDTDVMTEEGWKNIRSIQTADKIACLIDNQVRFFHPKTMIAQDSEETIEFKSKKIDLRVTPNHRMYVRFRQSKKYCFVPASSLLKSKTDLHFRRDYPWSLGKEVEFFDLPPCDWRHIGSRPRGETVNKPRNVLRIKMDLWLEFLGYWLAEGTLDYQEPSGPYAVMISQKAGNALFKRALFLCKEMGFHPNIYSHNRMQYQVQKGRSVNPAEDRLVIKNKQLALYLKENFKNKSIPLEFKNLSNRQLRIFFDSIYKEDGRKYKNGFAINTGIYEKYADDVQEICLKLGYSASIFKVGKCYIVRLEASPEHKYRTYGRAPKTIKERIGTYCLTVPGGLVFVRRNGLCCWSGNSHIFYKAFTSRGWSKYSYPTEINPTVKKEFLEEQRELIGETRYRQEYDAVFVDDARAYFPQATIRACVHSCESEKICEYCDISTSLEALAKYVEKSANSFYGGYDPGGRRDPAALVVVEKMKSEGKIRIVLVKTYVAHLHGKKVEDQNLYTRFTAEIADLNQRVKMKKLFVDQTGIGQPIVEQCRTLKLTSEGVDISSNIKEKILSNLKILFEQKKVIIPSADRDLELEILSNLNCIEADRKPAGGYVFSHPSGTHDDVAFALALAVWGASEKESIVIMMKSDEEPEKPSSWRMGLQK